jgi:putative sterol carrier protein
MWTNEAEAYRNVLDDFQQRFNTNPRVKKLVTGWNRLVLLDAVDTGSSYGLVIDSEVLSEVKSIREEDADDEGLVHLQAEESVLKEIFSGKYNPATALTDGALAVFSKERDKVKLEALAMVIWRLG